LEIVDEGGGADEHRYDDGEVLFEAFGHGGAGFFRERWGLFVAGGLVGVRVRGRL
jgi:hypothetical protein